MNSKASISTDTTALFARFPHLARIEALWGTPEGRRYISNLLTDDRGGKRQGFPPEHAKTIFALLMEHDRLFPECEPSSAPGTWQDAYQRGLDR